MLKPRSAIRIRCCTGCVVSCPCAVAAASSAAPACACCIPVIARSWHISESSTTKAVLCVFNLSRSAQAVELDLSACAGRVPVEMLGDSIFPPIGQLPYLLTLPPYGFYWFELSGEDALPAWHTPAPEPMPELRTRVFKAPLAEMLEGPLRADLEQNELKDYLLKRRWFSAKDRKISALGSPMSRRCPVPAGAWSWRRSRSALADATEHFSLPLATVDEADAVTALPGATRSGPVSPWPARRLHYRCVCLGRLRDRRPPGAAFRAPRSPPPASRPVNCASSRPRR